MSIWMATSPTKRPRIGPARELSYIRRLSSLAVALTGEAATDGSVAFGVNLNFSLDPRARLQSVAQAARPGGRGPRAGLSRPQRQWRARPGEPVEKGALVTTGTAAGRKTDRRQGLGHRRRPRRRYQPIAVGIDVTSLADPMLVPKKALQVVVPRPGVPAEVADRPRRRRRRRRSARQERRARVSKGSTSSSSTRAARRSPRPAPTTTASSCSNGSPTATYTIRVAQDSAAAAKICADLGIQFRGHSGQVDRPARHDPAGRAGAPRRAGARRLQARHSAELPELQRSRHAPAHSLELHAGAVEKTRTSTAFRPQRPQRCASTSSATTARHENEPAGTPALARRGP